MSLNLTKKSNKLRNFGIGGAIVIGTSLIVLNTFPHLKTSILNYIKGGEDEEVDNEPIELNEEQTISEPSRDIAEESMIDVNEWSNDNLKSWLSEVCIKC
ncbi:hypothetical protein CLIB1444_06S03246 [[Candida] jaroonii]|uniref:Uncharacterized protein n=1 Tax=[Candida] jaroonii TaxID=467808 RepID=A0ACA9Y9M2_9ASCO|nr:hypothetical protein CLIB1444_06S03246 [[Candida] jaroonii]